MSCLYIMYHNHIHHNPSFQNLYDSPAHLPTSLSCSCSCLSPPPPHTHDNDDNLVLPICSYVWVQPLGHGQQTCGPNSWRKIVFFKWPSTGYSFNVGVVPMLLLIYLFHTEVLTTLFLCLCLGINIVSIVLLCVGMYMHDCSCLYRTHVHYV